MAARDELRAAIAAAYAAFRSERPPTHLRAPSHHPRRLLHTLLSVPPSELTAEQLGVYASWAMTTVGTAPDYRYFLPRILELGTTRTDWLGLDPEMIAGKLVHGDWETWPGVQRSALSGWFGAGFHASLEISASRVCEPGGWLVGLARLRLPVGPLLAAWRGHDGGPAIMGLAGLVTSWSMAIDEGDPAPPYWNDADPPVIDAVKDWVFAAATRDQLRRAAGMWEVDRALAALSGPDAASRH